MKSQVIAAVVVLALSCVLASPQPAMGQGQKGNTAGQVLVAQAQGGPGAGARAEEGENHPQIRHAIKALENAKHYMQHAAHDFGGHREDALKACDEAIRQLNLALQYDKK